MTLATLVRQVARDVWHDLGWIVLYGVLMSCAAYALVLMAVNHALVADQGTATELFLERGAQTVTLSDVPVRATGGASGESSAPVSFAVSHDLAGEVSSALELDGTRYPLDVVGPDFGIPYPGYYEGPELVEANYRDTLFVFCPSYRLACKLIGERRSADALSGPLQRIVLFDPSPEDVARFRGAVLGATGFYARVTPLDEGMVSESFSSARTQLAVTSFSALAAAALAAALVASLLSALVRRVGELSIHHVFGAPLGLLYARMAAFALIYQALPTCLTLAAMAGLASVRAELVPAMVLVALAVVAEALLVALLAWRRLRTVARRGLRTTRGT